MVFPNEVFSQLVASNRQRDEATQSAQITVQPSVDKPIKGTVKDENGQALPGVSVVIKNTTQGTTTDANVTYQLTVPDAPSTTLVFSFVGYLPQEVPIGTNSEVNTTLLVDNKQLNEVVVGYGTQRRCMTGRTRPRIGWGTSSLV